MLNCIYQDSSRKSFTRILSFWNFRNISRNENHHQAFGSSFWLSANSSGISFYVKVHAVLDVKQISLTWILLIYSNFEILAYTRIIYAKKYWNVFAFLSGVSKWLVIYFDRFYTFFTAVCSILVSSQSIFGKETFYDFSDKINNTKYSTV